MSDVNAISFGPCWCCGDTTTGGHWHGSADGGNVVEAKLETPTEEDNDE